MTQPIQEPTTDRALQGFAYARDQIFRRPAPTGLGDSCAQLTGWSASDPLIPADEWSQFPVAGEFLDFYKTDDLWVGSSTGGISRSQAALYHVNAWVQFADLVEGDVVGVAVKQTPSAFQNTADMSTVVTDSGGTLVVSYASSRICQAGLSLDLNAYAYCSANREISAMEISVHLIVSADNLIYEALTT